VSKICKNCGGEIVTKKGKDFILFEPLCECKKEVCGEKT